MKKKQLLAAGLALLCLSACGGKKAWEPEIQRTTLDSKGYAFTCYAETPVFPGEGEGYAAINAFFQAQTDAFFAPENEGLSNAWAYVKEAPPGPDDAPYCYERTAVIQTCTEKLVSVSLCEEWYMGGTDSYWSDSYTFRTDTGEALKLTDLAEGTEEELKAAILAALEEKDGGSGELYLDQLKAYDLDQFEFCVHEGKILLLFDKYEAADGAYGGFDLELPLELRDIWNK